MEADTSKTKKVYYWSNSFTLLSYYLWEEKQLVKLQCIQSYLQIILVINHLYNINYLNS